MSADVLPLHRTRRETPASIGRPGAFILLGLLWGGLALAFLAGIGIGPVVITPTHSLSILAEQIGLPRLTDFPAQQAAILLNIRMPRVVLAILVGGALGMGGAALQGLFRNPLADPGLLGVSSGGAFGAVAVIVLGTAWVGPVAFGLNTFILPVAAFLGALAAAAVVYAIAQRQGRSDRAAMLLAGIAVNAVAGSATGLLVYLSDNEQLKSLTFWLMGSLGGADWHTVLVLGIFISLPILALPRLARALNAMLMGDAVAGHLGFDPVWINRWTVILVTAIVGAAVAVSGVIGFIGLIAPHMVRLLGGPDHRLVLPGSALTGAILLTAADILARTVAAPSDLPIGVVTGALGGPFFIWLLLRRSSYGRNTC